MSSGPEAIAALDDNLGALKMLRGLVATMRFNEAALKERAGKYFTQGTELSDMLFREKGISFRTAHRIVGTLVRQALAQGKTAADIDARMLNDAAVEITGEPIPPPYENLWKVLDPMGVVNAHNGLGGPAPEAVDRALKNRIAKLNEDKQDTQAKRERLTKAQKDMENAVKLLINTGE
jgi:argininosuccinate lyase